MTSVVYVIAQKRFDGDLAAICRLGHVWLWLTEENTRVFDAACSSGDLGDSAEHTLSGYPQAGDALDDLYRYLGTIDGHHTEPSSDETWDEIRILGIDAAQLDQDRVNRELDADIFIASGGADWSIIRRIS